MAYAAKAPRENPNVVMFKVSPFATVLEVLSAADHKKLPAVEASQTETSVMVSEAVIENDGVLLSAIAPLEAAL
jgi:hypothetical protein